MPLEDMDLLFEKPNRPWNAHKRVMAEVRARTVVEGRGEDEGEEVVLGGKGDEKV